MKHSLEVYFKSDLIFHSDNHWLHPLFELESFLISASISAQHLFLKDKIIGKAAALLIVNLKISSVYTKTLSNLGKAVLEEHNINFEYMSLLDRIDCKTEILMADINDPAEAYRFIQARIKKNN